MAKQSVAVKFESQTKAGDDGVYFKVSDKGGVSVYGMGRFPTTLYYDQWVKLLAHADELEAFVEQAKAAGKLSLRDD